MMPTGGIPLKVWQALCDMPKSKIVSAASMCEALGLQPKQNESVRVALVKLEREGVIYLTNPEIKATSNGVRLYSRLPPAMHHKLPENIHPVTLYTLWMEGVTLGDNHGRL